MNNSMITALLFMIVLDYITGIIVAIYEKKLNSAIGRKGIFKKVGILICMVCCGAIDALRINGDLYLVPIVTIFFTLNEAISILENLAKLNVPIPKILLETIKENQKEEINDKK